MSARVVCVGSPSGAKLLLYGSSTTRNPAPADYSIKNGGSLFPSATRQKSRVEKLTFAVTTLTAVKREVLGAVSSEIF